MIIIARYFIPFIFLSNIVFSEQCNEHLTYYELWADSIGNQVEYVKLTQNDSIIQIYHYSAENKPDSNWISPIQFKMESLQRELDRTKDKDKQKYLKNQIEWLKNRYF